MSFTSIRTVLKFVYLRGRINLRFLSTDVLASVKNSTLPLNFGFVF
jgi:hypothetical protein